MADILNLVDEYFHYNQNIESELYLEFINNIFLKYKHIDKEQFISYSIKKFFQEIKYGDVLFDFISELLETNIYDTATILKEIVSNFIVNYNECDVKRFLYSIIEIKPDIIQYSNILHNLIEKEQIKSVYNIYNIRKEIDKYFSNLNVKNNEDDLKIFNFLEHFPEEIILDENILFCEMLMSYIDCGLGNVDQFVEKLVEQEYIGDEIDNFCKYIIQDYEYYDKNNSFIFKNTDNSLTNLLEFLLNTNYLDLENKISYISNICYKIYTNDLKNETTYLENVENFFDSKTEYKEIYNEVNSNISCFKQKNAACTLYNEYKNAMTQKKDEYIELFNKNIENYINFFDTKYGNSNFFITELDKIGKENKDDYLLNMVQSFAMRSMIKSFGNQDIEVVKK